MKAITKTKKETKNIAIQMICWCLVSNGENLSLLETNFVKNKFKYKGRNMWTGEIEEGEITIENGYYCYSPDTLGAGRGWCEIKENKVKFGYATGSGKGIYEGEYDFDKEEGYVEFEGFRNSWVDGCEAFFPNHLDWEIVETSTPEKPIIIRRFDDDGAETLWEMRMGKPPRQLKHYEQD